MLQEIHRLTQENNRLLHKMRRSAMWGRLVTFVIYAALLLAPVWFYLTYLNGTVQQLLKMYGQLQGGGQQAQGEYQQIQQALQQLQQKFQSFTSTSSHQ